VVLAWRRFNVLIMNMQYALDLPEKNWASSGRVWGRMRSPAAIPFVGYGTGAVDCGRIRKMAISPDVSEQSTGQIDIPACSDECAQTKQRRLEGSGGVVMTGEFIDPAEGHYSLLIGSDGS
jgi:hypothetical protein